VFVVELADEGEEKSGIGLNDEQNGLCGTRCLPRGAATNSARMRTPRLNPEIWIR
jgi:hypothetical protein